MILMVTNQEFENLRLDVYITENTDFTRSFVSNKIKEGKVTVNGETVTKNSYQVKISDVVFIEDDVIKELDVVAEDIDLNIVYEDDDILIVDKERGMVVHPSNGHHSGTLVNAVMSHCKGNLSSINGVIRPGIVHRIDKDTSGLLCICKNDKSHQSLARQFMEHSNIRKYKTIVKGRIKEDSGTIKTHISRDKKNRLRMAVNEDGKLAITEYKILERFKDYTYLECNLHTGRTHQIRVHMKHIGHPVLGDKLYSSVDKNFRDVDGQVLHAYYMEFTHPSTKERVSFNSELPEYFTEILEKLRKNGQQ